MSWRRHASSKRRGPEAGAAPGHPAPARHREGHAPVHARTTTPTRSRSTCGRPRTQIKAAVEELFNVRVEKVRTQTAAGQEAPLPLPHRQAVELEEGDRHAARGRQDRVLLRVGRAGERQRRIASDRGTDACTARQLRDDHGHSSIQTDDCRAARQARSAISPRCTDRKKNSRRSRCSSPRKKKGGRNNQGVICIALPRRRPQADVPHHRLQAQQGRRLGRRSSSIEYDPNRSARIALLQYEDGEKTLHPRAGRAEGGRQGHQRRRRRAARRQLPAAAEDPAGHDGPQPRDAAGPRRADLPQRRHAAPR